jgi:hypothetical protein
VSAGVFLNIERIVLHGMDHVDARALAAALQKSLSEQLAANPIHDAAASAWVRTQISLPESCNAEQMGRALAQSLHGVIVNEPATAGRGGAGGRGGRSDA